MPKGVYQRKPEDIERLTNQIKNTRFTSENSKGNKNSLGIISSRKNKTYEEIYGEEKAKEMKEKLVNILLDKTYEEIHGEEKAILIKNKLRKNMIGKKYALNYKHTEEAKNRIRINNPFYVGKTPKNRKRFGLWEWDKKRRLTYKRDDYICRDCGKNNIIVSAHHIQPSLLGGADDMNNLKTLCRSCHSIADYQFQFLL